MPRYDWAKVQQHYDSGHTYADCRSKFGFSQSSGTDAIKRGVLRVKPRQLTVLHYLKLNTTTRWQARRRLLDEGLLRLRCYECGISEWFGQPLSLHLDHINGVKNDHRIENLRMLCPNCHSQTETFGGRNTRRGSTDALEA